MKIVFVATDLMRTKNFGRSGCSDFKHEISWSESISTDATLNGGAPRCKCERNAEVYTSKTFKNLNKAFYDCPYFKVIKHPN